MSNRYKLKSSLQSTEMVRGLMTMREESLRFLDIETNLANLGYVENIDDINDKFIELFETIEAKIKEIREIEKQKGLH